jgi:hypothetical protein
MMGFDKLLLKATHVSQHRPSLGMFRGAHLHLQLLRLMQLLLLLLLLYQPREKKIEINRRAPFPLYL